MFFFPPSAGGGPGSQTTTPACRDSPDMDCKQMDDSLGICAKNDPATKRYCPKYCKIC